MSFSFRNFFRHGGREARARVGDRQQAQRLVDRGIAAATSGSASRVLEYYRRAVRADDGFAPGHLNLGLALQAAGEASAATACFERAIALDPACVAAHYNLACARLVRLQYTQAEASFRGALRLRDDFSEAWAGLAAALEAQGHNEDALAALNKAIALRSDYVEALLNSLTLLRKMGRADAAAANSRRVLQLEPENYVAHCTLGLSLHFLGQLPEAESSYRQALTFKPDYAEARTNLASLLRAAGRNEEAIPLLVDAVAAEPASAQLRRNLGEALHGFALDRAGAKERNVLLTLCMDDEVLDFVVPSILASIRSDEGFLTVQNDQRRGEDPFVSMAPPVAAFLRNPLLLAALPRVAIGDVEVEEVLTYIRRCILFRFAPAPSLQADAPEISAGFICALARQCFFSAYVFSVTEGELERIAGLRAALQNTLSQAGARPQEHEASLAVFSLYDALYTLDGFERLLEHPLAGWSETFRPLVQEQVENRLREREIAAQIASITTIDDEISRAVRAQYEDNPYPRWVTLQTPNIDTIEKLSSRLRPGQEARTRARPVPILVAGCGTGRHPIMVARTFPDAEVLAVDLSLASLAYAARMTEKLGISNITYRQGDILQLGTLERRFAIIECCGVLHHLHDPMAGWRVLVGLLEADGFMRIALYSEKARHGVRAAWEVRRSLNLPSTPDGIRRCREAIMRLPDGHPARKLMNSADFFTLDTCRDFIMHVQEHQFTLPRLEECLDQLGLEFLGFECLAATWKRFRAMFPGNEMDNSLRAWHQFEEAYPDTFFGTYSFACGRK